MIVFPSLLDSKLKNDKIRLVALFRYAVHCSRFLTTLFFNQIYPWSEWRTKGSQRQWKTKRKKRQSFKQIEARRSWLVLLAGLLIGSGVNNTPLAMFNLERTIMTPDYTRPVWKTLCGVCFRHSNVACVVFWKIFSPNRTSLRAMEKYSWTAFVKI